MGIYTEISAALNTQLARLEIEFPIQWPNTDYLPIEGTLFVRPTLLPATGVLNTLAGSYLQKGIYQIDVFCPLDMGMSVLTDITDIIYDLFSSDKVLTSNNQNIFIQDIVQGKAERTQGWYMGFVEIHYSCYTN